VLAPKVVHNCIRDTSKKLVVNVKRHMTLFAILPV
jgi:hypothetical protein